MSKIAICDDCAADRKRLITHIRKKTDQENEIHICEFASGEELLAAMEDVVFSAVFLDIQMQGIDGNETAKKLRELDSNLVLIFYTGYAEPSPVSFEVQPYRYIMKNMTVEQIDRYVDAALKEMLRLGKIPFLFSNIGKEHIMINSENIVYIEKYKKTTRLHLTQQAYVMYGVIGDGTGGEPDIRFPDKLDRVYETLKKYGFGWPHDSYVVNFKYLYSCTAKTFQLAGVKDKFQITRSKAKEFNRLRDNFFCSKYIGREKLP